MKYCTIIKSKFNLFDKCGNTHMFVIPHIEQVPNTNFIFKKIKKNYFENNVLLLGFCL